MVFVEDADFSIDSTGSLLDLGQTRMSTLILTRTFVNNMYSFGRLVTPYLLDILF